MRALTSFVGDSIASYASAEAAAKKMTTALQAQGTATPGVVKQFNDLAGAFQRTTVYSDDLINEMQALLTQVGNVAPSQMEKALQAATNLASGLGVDLRAATILVSKASEENVGALKKAGLQLDETRVAAEGMSYILGVVNDKFGGQAQAEVDTYAGKVKQLANEWDNLKEIVGKNIAEDPLLRAALQLTTNELRRQNTATTEAVSSWQIWIERLDRVVNPSKLAAAAMSETARAANEAADAFAAAARTIDASPLRTGAAFSFGELDAKARAEIDATIAAWKRQDAAAKQHADAIESMFRKLSGADATAEMQKLDAVFRRLADSGVLTQRQIDAVVKEAIKLQADGAKMTERLWEMVRATEALSPGLNATALDVGKLGTQIAVSIPTLDAYSAALAKVGLATGGLSKLPGVNVGLPTIPVAPKGLFDSIFGSSGQFGQQMASTVLGAIQGGGNPVSAASGLVGTKIGSGIAESLTKEGGKLFGTALGGVLNSALPLVGSLVGPLAGALWNKLFGTAGRDAVKDFAATFKGGFDGPGGLHEALNTLGAEGERLWIKLTQGVGRNNPEQAKKVIAEITAALANQKTQTEMAAVSAAAAAIAQQAELDAISAKYSDVIGKLESEYKTLSDSVAKEAEEEFMGLTEIAERERMKQLADEKAFQEAKRDAEIATKKSTFEEMLIAGEKVDKELRELFGRRLDIPYRFVPENMPGSTTYAPSATYTPPTRPTGTDPNSVPLVTNINLNVDGRTLATAVANTRAKLRMT